jgi:D-amino-acid oxidase
VIVVVGAGVVGLTCAVRLAEAGHRVRVIAREEPLATTSAVAAALWFPYLSAPRDRVLAWAAATRRELERLAAVEPGSGVALRELLLIEPCASLAASGEPWWASAVPAWRPARGAERAAAGDQAAHLTTVPVAESPRYLPWLLARLRSAGGELELRPEGLAELRDVPAETRAVVHCSGLGARQLAGDATVLPVRGQVALVGPLALERAVVDDRDAQRPVYVIPRRDDVVVGGTAEVGSWELAVDAATTTALLDRACRLVPELAAAPLLGARVGLRPTRPEVRLERERAGDPPVVHCYGHGGAGLTLSWGCADEVCALVEPALG